LSHSGNISTDAHDGQTPSLNALFSGSSEKSLATANSSSLLTTANASSKKFAAPSHQISILSADVYTRPDGIVLDLFRVCNEDLKAIEDRNIQKAIVKTLYDISEKEDFDAAKYLQKKVNFLKPETEQVVKFPVRAWVSNQLDPHFTVIEIQALDRIGLLHDVLKTVNDHGLQTVHSRICTEKGAALDSIFVQTLKGRKLVDPEAIKGLEESIRKLLSG
jgi:[protein-PII] uridylyltransferase